MEGLCWPALANTKCLLGCHTCTITGGPQRFMNYITNETPQQSSKCGIKARSTPVWDETMNASIRMAARWTPHMTFLNLLFFCMWCVVPCHTPQWFLILLWICHLRRLKATPTTHILLPFSVSSHCWWFKTINYWWQISERYWPILLYSSELYYH